ncbi:hypothetical protein GCM10023185_12790 [Hymenobacter saemangeumensis]|uniref:Lipocalin-like domain-containing protein n=1 Tax=Hymenobacter saemangeumensis TaxID=1084522 RepID=A0ABP8I752_9BACT
MKQIVMAVLVWASISASWAQTPKAKPKTSKPVTPAAALLQGVWAVSEEENAVFWVKGNRLTYVEFLDQPLRYALTPSTLTIYQSDGPDKYRIKKLTRDSLVMVHSLGAVMRLYKRR